MGVEMLKQAYKASWIAIGFLSVGIGTAGTFLPILPTAPLYLLAAYCFANGSERFHKWFTGTRLLKKHIEGFAKNNGMTLKSKHAILIPVTIMLTVACLMINVLTIRIVIAVLLLTKYWYIIFQIKTIRATSGTAFCENISVVKEYGGFSMGSVATWRTFQNGLDYFRYFLPMSCGTTLDDENIFAAAANHDPSDYFVFVFTGTEDFSFRYDENRAALMRNSPYFIESDNELYGNFAYRIKEGYTHDGTAAMEYTYNGLR